MQFFHSISLAALLGFASAACNQSGIDFYDKSDADHIAYAACSTTLSGTYGPESTYNGMKGACLNTENGKIDFLITHITDGSRDLPVDECYDGLQKEIWNCGKGGETSYTNWKYK